MVESLFLKEYNNLQEQNKTFCAKFKGINAVGVPFVCHRPLRQTAALVLDSPHSGNIYPPDFGYACPKAWLEETEDAFVDELFSDAPVQGAPLLKALFPRCYIDANRAEDDIDPQLLSEPWPGRANPSERSRMGLGLIRRVYKTGNQQPLYDRLLTVAEVKRRLDTCYYPYHKTLAGLIDDTVRDFGAVWHINCHSMPSQGWAAAQHAADIVLGDRDGTSCHSAFTRFAARCLKGMGYRVEINRPYKGVEILRRYGDPVRNRHSLQIELQRSLYMDEQSRQKNAGFIQTHRNMSLFVRHIIDFTRENLIDLAAD